MNDTENIVPLSLRHENTRKHQRKPLANPHPRNQSQTLGKPNVRPKRRALGDITNKANAPLQPLNLKPKPEKLSRDSFRVWQDEDDVPDPEFVPPPPVPKPYQPASLFSETELAEMRREMQEEEEEEDNDGTDEFGRPFLPNEEIPVPPPPYEEEEDVGDDGIERLGMGLGKDYFSPDQLFPKDELPVLELA